MGWVEINTQVFQHNLQGGGVDALGEIIQGLQSSQKYLPSKLFYDKRGSKLFDQICELDEYYLTRTETGILRENLREISEMMSPDCVLIEYGSGSSMKTRWMLDNLSKISAYMPVDISREQLYSTAESLDLSYPNIKIFPIWADFTKEFSLPPLDQVFASRLAYFPGSTIGNFYPDEAVGFMRNVARLVGKGGGFLIGFDLQKDPGILNTAYNDRQGITAAFNLNILTHLNREYKANFVEKEFEHSAFYNQVAGRIEMHLVSKTHQQVRLNESMISFQKDESILTEVSYKYTLDGFAGMAYEAGFNIRKVWVDSKNYFSVQYLVPR